MDAAGMAHEGLGHSCGIHTALPERARALAEDLDVVRVLVNQAHTFGNGGSFDNGLPFTLSMGCGTWAGNSISENLNYRHFINITHLVTTIPDNVEVFGERPGAFGQGRVDAAGMAHALMRQDVADQLLGVVEITGAVDGEDQR